MPVRHVEIRSKSMVNYINRS